MTQINAYPQNEYCYLEEVRSILKNVLARESKRHQMDQHLTPQTEGVVEEILAMLEEELDYDPTPQYDPSLAGI